MCSPTSSRGLFTVLSSLQTRHTAYLCEHWTKPVARVRDMFLARASATSIRRAVARPSCLTVHGNATFNGTFNNNIQLASVRASVQRWRRYTSAPNLSAVRRSSQSMLAFTQRYSNHSISTTTEDTTASGGLCMPSRETPPALAMKGGRLPSHCTAARMTWMLAKV